MNGFELVRRHHIRLIVGIGVFTAIVTQILMQTGGGERDGTFDLGDSLAPFIDSFVFEGLPSFISSGGIYEPEIHLFKIGFTICGLLTTWLVIRMGRRGGPLNKNGTWFEYVATGIGVTNGICLMLLVHLPFTVYPLSHHILAAIIFSSGLGWILSAHWIIGEDDDTGLVFNFPSRDVRRWSLILGIGSGILIGIPFLMMQLELAAILEWGILAGLQGGLLSMEGLLDNSD